MVPVWGGGSDVIIEGSTWGRAGRRLRRIVLVFFGRDSRFVEEVGALRICEGFSGGTSSALLGAETASRFGEVSTSAILSAKTGRVQISPLNKTVSLIKLRRDLVVIGM